MAANYGRSVIRSRTAGTGRFPPLGGHGRISSPERRESAKIRHPRIFNPSAGTDKLTNFSLRSGILRRFCIYKSTLSGRSRADYQRYRPNCVASAHGFKLTCQYPQEEFIALIGANAWSTLSRQIAKTTSAARS